MPLTEAQRAARASRVGASEVAALLGEHPYMDKLDVWERIVLGREVEVTQSMRIGQYLEPHVLRMLKWEGIRARTCHRAYVHPVLPLSASPDAYARPHRGYGPGLVEVKVTGAWMDVPAYVYWQAMTQLLLAGREVNWVAALQGSRLTVVPVERDPLAFVRILEAVEAFDRHYLKTGIAPQRDSVILRGNEHD